MKLLRVWLTFPCLLFVTALANGQATTGSISGRVTDPTGAVVPDASVLLTDIDNGTKVTVKTGSEGEFNQTTLPPDHYTVTVAHEGFSSSTVSAFKLDIDQKARFNIKLKLGPVSVDVVVSDLAPVLETQGGETGQVIGSKEITDLPTLGHDFSSLLLLVPGVVHGGGGNNLNLSVNGQREFSNSVQVNGVEVTGNRNNDTNVRPSPDATQEFKVVTSGYAPEFGRASGGAVLIQTKSGTNQIHGSAFYFYRPTATAANNALSPRGTTPTLQQNNYGATIGGPIKRDKAFLFLAYEGFRQKNSAAYQGETLVGVGQVTFTPAGDADLSKLLDPYTGKQVPIFDPYYFQGNGYYYMTQQYPGNVIPAAVVSPAGRNIIQQLFPKPQTNNPYLNYLVHQNYTQNNNVGNLRADYTFSQNNKVYLTYDAQQGDTYASDPYGGSISFAGGGGVDSGGYTAYENHAVALTYDHVFTSSLVNEARATYFLSPVTQASLVDGSRGGDKLGIKNANINGFTDTYGLPQFQVGSGAATGGSTYKPLSFRDRNLAFIDSVNYTRGHHNIKFGYEYRHLNSHPDFSLFPVPYEYFAGPGSNFTSDNTYSNFYDPNAFYYNGGAEIADILLGLPQVVYQGLQLTKPNTTANEHTFYLQDSWQVNSKLNLTFGVRYEYQQPYVDAGNNESNFDISTLSVNIAGRGSNSRSLVDSNTQNFMPRVGVSYQLTPRTVLRGGYGKFYSPENDAREDILTKNYPFFTQQKFVNDIYGGYIYKLDTGVARATTVALPAGASSINLTTVAGANVQQVYSEPKTFPTANSQNYNLSMEQEFGNATTFELSYVGASTRDLSYEVGDYNVNQRLSSKVGPVQALMPIGISNYDSMQAKVNRRFAKGLSVLVSYTWSHSRDNGPAPFNLGKGGNYPQNPFNIASEYASSTSDARNNVTAAEVIELPFGRGKRFLNSSGLVLDLLVGGWQLNSISTFASGTPFNIRSNGNNPSYPGLRPNLTGNPNVSHRSVNGWINRNAFTIPTGQAGSTAAGKTLITGTLGRDAFTGPGYTNEDVSLFKVISLPREMKFQIRAEAFNVLNVAHYANPDGDLSHLGTTAHPGTFGTITGGYSPRVLQFAGRLTF